MPPTDALDPLPLARAPHPPVALPVGVVGVGRRAQAHLETIAALARAGYYELIGVCDHDQARAADVAARYHCAAFASVAALLEALGRRTPAIVVIVTPPEGHHPVAELAAAAGVHVLCETPLSFSVACADRMVAAAARAGTLLETAENVWRFPEERAKRLLIEAGCLGDVQLIQCRYASGSYHGLNAIRHLARAPVEFVLGQAQTMRTPEQPRAGGGKTGSVAWEAALLRCAGGIVATFQLPARPGLGNHWEVDGSAGWLDGPALHTADPRGPGLLPERLTADRDGREVLVALRYRTEPEVIWENPFRDLPIPGDTDAIARADEHLSLHRAACGAGSSDYPGAQGRADLAAVAAIHESAARGGQPIALPLGSGGPYEQMLHLLYAQTFGFPPEEAAAFLEQTAFPPSYPLTR